MVSRRWGGTAGVVCAAGSQRSDCHDLSAASQTGFLYWFTGLSASGKSTTVRKIEIVKHQGTVICAAVSPYRATRNDVRNMVGGERFVEVFVNTPLEECERRDVKGMYLKARRGEIKNFTGIDDPYEAPVQPELVIDTMANSAEDNARLIVKYLEERGFLR